MGTQGSKCSEFCCFVCIWVNAVQHIFLCFPGKNTVAYQKAGKRLGFGLASSLGVCARGQQAEGGLVLTPRSHSSPTCAAAQVTCERCHHQWGQVKSNDLDFCWNTGASHWFKVSLQPYIPFSITSSSEKNSGVNVLQGSVISSAMTQQNQDTIKTTVKSNSKKSFLPFTGDSFLNKIAVQQWSNEIIEWSME